MATMTKTQNRSAKRRVKSSLAAIKPDAQMTNEQIGTLATTICSSNVDLEGRIDAFLLLIDEIERAQRDAFRIDRIQNYARAAGYMQSDHAGHSQDALINKLRSRMRLPMVRL
jgi:hypothetical protein